MSKKRSSSKASKAAQTKELRTKQFEQILEVIDSLESRLQYTEYDQKNQLTLLSSVSHGLYEEVDKLSKKAPSEPVTDLVLEQVNDVIRETKQLVADDTYVQRLNEFVPAGDNPQHRDAVVVLRQIRQGLDRFRQSLEPSIRALNGRRDEARAVTKALQLYMDGDMNVETEQIEDYGLSLSSFWKTGIYPETFNFDRLDEIDIRVHFGETAKL